MAALHSMQGLSSLAWDRTQAPCSESTQSYPLDCWGVLQWLLDPSPSTPKSPCTYAITLSSVSPFLTFPLDQSPDIIHVPQSPSPNKTFLGSPHPIFSFLPSSSIPVFLQEKSTQTASSSHPWLVGWASILAHGCRDSLRPGLCPQNMSSSPDMAQGLGHDRGPTDVWRMNEWTSEHNSYQLYHSMTSFSHLRIREAGSAGPVWHGIGPRPPSPCYHDRQVVAGCL